MGGEGHDAHFQQFEGDQARGRQVTEAHGDIDTLGDQVTDLIACHQFQQDQRTGLKKATQTIGKEQPREIRIDIHASLPRTV
jgi:hypothetical protein